MITRYHAFLDESGQRRYGRGTDRYFVVAGAISHSKKYKGYSYELKGIKRAFFGEPGVEIKSHWLRRPEKRKAKYLDVYGISDKMLDEFVEAIYNWLLATDLVVIAGVIDKEQMVEQYVNPHNPSSLGYQVFLQRYQKFLAPRHSQGAITFDKVSGTTLKGRQWQDLLDKHHCRLKVKGCQYTNTSFPNIGDSLAFSNSATEPLLQIADLAAYNTFRQSRDFGHIWDDPSSKELPVYQYFDLMLPRFYQDHNGVFAGFGVAKMPLRSKHRWMVLQQKD